MLAVYVFVYLYIYLNILLALYTDKVLLQLLSRIFTKKNYYTKDGRNIFLSLLGKVIYISHHSHLFPFLFIDCTDNQYLILWMHNISPKPNCIHMWWKTDVLFRSAFETRRQFAPHCSQTRACALELVWPRKIHYI